MAKQYTQAGKALVQQHEAKDAVRGELERHQQFLKARQDQLARWVTGGVRPEALIRFVLLDLQQNAKLRACDPGSIYLGLLACAQTGLEPGALKGEAYLVPFGGKAQFIAGWKGLVKMARRSREVLSIGAEVVHEHDLFTLRLGTDPIINHEPARGDRGQVIGAYAVARLKNGGRELEYMDIQQLDAVRRIAEARGKSPAWAAWSDEMQRKTVIRRLCKRLPLGQDYFVAGQLEQAHDDGQSQAEILDVLTDGEASRAEKQAAGARAMLGEDPGPIDETEAAEILAAEKQNG